MKKNLLICIGIVLGFLVLSYAFVPELLSGKIVNQSDISGWQGMSHEKLEWDKAHPDAPAAWTGSMFSGMPATSIQSSTKGDWTQTLYNLLLTGKRPATYFFISLLGAFLLMLSLGISPLVAAGGAVAVTFCAYNVQIIQVGHNTKMQALAFLPWVFAAMVFTYRKATAEGGPKWALTALGAALFGLALSFQIKANHPQISYYLALMILIYVVVLFVSLLRRRQPLKGFWVASALLLVLGLAGIGTNAIKLLPTWEYTPYSMRGGASSPEGADGGKASKGLDLDYATAWSYGWEELPNLMIPNYNGGASAGPLPMDSETVQLLRQAGQPNLQQVRKHLPTYWGPQPFTAGPMYMGAVTVFLFILGLMYWKGREKWWAVAASLLAVLLALGSHFLWFTKLFFAIAPLYNKFRTVSMALVVLQFTLPVLGFLMLDGIVKSSADGKVLRRQVLMAGGVTLGLMLLLALAQSAFGTFSGASDAGQPDILVDALAADRHSLLWGDTLRSLLLVAAATLLLLWGSFGAPKNTFPLHPQGTGGVPPETPCVASLQNDCEAKCGETAGFDAVLILRGGGSTLDLACFDDYELCAAIARFPLPVFTAIGHDRDTHIADLVACEAVKTPTALADLFIDAVAREDERIQDLSHRLRMGLLACVSASEAALDKSLRIISLAMSGKISGGEQKLSELQSRILTFNPRKLLESGYTLVTDPSGKLLRSSKGLKSGDLIDLRFPDGTVNCTVNG